MLSKLTDPFMTMLLGQHVQRAAALKTPSADDSLSTDSVNTKSADK